MVRDVWTATRQQTRSFSFFPSAIPLWTPNAHVECSAVDKFLTSRLFPEPIAISVQALPVAIDSGYRIEKVPQLGEPFFS